MRWSTGRARTCSGDMYPTVPITTPGCVGATVGERVSPGSACRELREAEVEDLHVTILRHEHVLGLQVPVDDPLLVGRGEAARDL